MTKTMSDSPDKVDALVNDEKLHRTLKDALRTVKNRDADREDVVVELKEAEAARLSLLADELRPVFNDIDDADQRFDFGLSKGDRPRLWIDMTSFVAMGHDKHSYRFLKDTRGGRIVLAETREMDRMADIVSEYVAERVLERERMMDGEWQSQKSEPSDATSNLANAPVQKSNGFWRSMFWFVAGAAVTIAVLIAATLLMVPDAL